MIRKNCATCGRFTWKKPYQVKRCENLYCSHSCSARGTQNGKTYDFSDKPDLTCDNCGNKLSTHQKQQYYAKIENGRKPSNKYCGRECMFKYYRTETDCELCGRTFTHPKSVDRKLCSPECVKNYQHDRDRERNGGKRKLIKNCSVCGEEFITKRYNDDKHGRCKRCKGKSPKRITSHVLTPGEAKRVADKFRSRMSVKNLSDHYVKTCLSHQIGTWDADIPQELIEIKRLNIKRKRIIRNHNQKQ